MALAAAASGIAAVVVWSWIVAQPGWRQGVAALTWVAAAAWAGNAWRCSPVGELAWNGRAWVWSTGQADLEVTVVPVLDLQRALLVRMRSGGSPGPAAQWLWIEQGARPGAWRALRRAVYSPARPEALPAGGPPPANS